MTVPFSEAAHYEEGVASEKGNCYLIRMRIALVACVGIFAVACAHGPQVSREPAEVRAEEAFSEPARWAQLKEISEHLDLSRANLSLSSGGTSVYAVVSQNGKAIGAVIPENSATKLSGELLSFTLARAFGISKFYQSAIYFPLRDQNLTAFRAMIPRAPQKNAAKESNRKNILARIAAHPEGIDAIFKKWDTKPVAYDALVGHNRLNSSHVLSGGSAPFASLLKCDGPRPSAQRQVRINGGVNTELELARQMSSMLLIDAIVQQWDRFSGGNLQTVTSDGKVNFASYDNGGTWSSPWTAKNLSLVSRFDRKVAQRILDLNQFLNLGGHDFLGLKTEKEVMDAMGAANFPNSFAKMKSSLAVVAKHIEKYGNCFFE